MRMHASWRGVARLALVASLTTTCASCAATGGLSRSEAGARLLPAVADVIPAPAARPAPARGEDARIFARRALDYGDANAAALTDAAARYGAIAATLARPPAE